jgi:hypothetical protein
MVQDAYKMKIMLEEEEGVNSVCSWYFMHSLHKVHEMNK